MPQEGKRRQASGGCLTCKSRHVKCDEAKPSCARCRKAWLPCGGYSNDSRPPARQSVAVVAAIAPQKNPNKAESPELVKSLELRSLSPLPDLISTEKRLLDFFLVQSLPMLQTYATVNYLSWPVLAVQMVQSCEVARLAALTLAAQHSKLECNQHANAFLVPSLYSRTIRGLSKAIAEIPKPTPGLLFASLFCAILESLLQRPKAMRMHVLAGLHLREQVGAPTESQSHGRELMGVQEVLSHLAFGSKVREPKMLPSPDSPPSKVYRNLTTCGKPVDLHEMLSFYKTQMCDLGWQVTTFVIRITIGNPNHETPDLIVGKLRDLIARLAAFRARQNVRDHAVCGVLQARCMFYVILAQCCITRYQTTYDRHTAEFAELIELLSVSLDTLHELNGRRQTLFSVELDIISTLSFIAFFCRDPALRRWAISLFDKCPRFEGEWSAAECQQYGRAVVEFEERDARAAVAGSSSSSSSADSFAGPPSAAHIPEGSRVQMAQLCFGDDGSRSALFLYKPVATMEGFACEQVSLASVAG